MTLNWKFKNQVFDQKKPFKVLILGVLSGVFMSFPVLADGPISGGGGQPLYDLHMLVCSSEMIVTGKIKKKTPKAYSLVVTDVGQMRPEPRVKKLEFDLVSLQNVQSVMPNRSTHTSFVGNTLVKYGQLDLLIDQRALPSSRSGEVGEEGIWFVGPFNPFPGSSTTWLTHSSAVMIEDPNDPTERINANPLKMSLLAEVQKQMRKCKPLNVDEED